MQDVLNRLFSILVKRDEKALQNELGQPYVGWPAIFIILLLSGGVSYALNQLFTPSQQDAFNFLQNPLLFMLWSVVIFFFIISLSHLIAKVFGSQGKLKNYAYVSAIMGAIVSILNPLVLAIPFVGSIGILLLGGYTLFLQYFMGSYVYNMRTKSTLVIVFAPVVLFVAIFSCYIMFTVASTMNV